MIINDFENLHISISISIYLHLPSASLMHPISSDLAIYPPAGARGWHCLVPGNFDHL